MSFEPLFVLDDSYLEPDIVTDEAYVGHYAWPGRGADWGRGFPLPTER